MLGEVFHFYLAKSTDTDMQGDRLKINTVNFHFPDDVLGKVHSGNRSGYRSFLGSKNGLKTLLVVICYFSLKNIFRNRRFTQLVYGRHHLFVISVKQKTNSSAP